MRFRDYIREEYIARVDEYEIFKNPSWKELRSCDEIVRFIADPKKKELYITDYRILHPTMFKKIGKSWKGYSNYLLGTAEREGSKYVMFESDQIDYDMEGTARRRRKWNWIPEENWSWLNKYHFDVSNWIESKFK